MAEIYIVGEAKIRPGAYFNIQKKDTNAQADIVSGVTAILFKSDFGPINTAVELSATDNYMDIFGNEGTTDAIQEAINGGAKTIIACRVGNGGTTATITLNDREGEAAVTITANYPGKKAFTVTIREKLSDSTLKECIIYAGTTEFEKVEFAAGTKEAAALVEAFLSSKKFKAELKSGKEEAVLQVVSQSVFTDGTDPQATISDYSNAFAVVESFDFNTICVDTEDTAVHLLLQAFVNRIFHAGILAQAVVAEKHTVELETRQEHAAAFNDEKMHYVLNAYISEQGKKIDGYQTAARFAGLIGACTSNTSLTHTVIQGFTEILERLTNSQIVAAQKKGCLVLSYNSAKQVWIDNAINTLITPADNQDDGWKKIRRVKTRFELIRRMNVTADNLVGKIDNDKNGRATIISQLQAVGTAMVSERKLISCIVSESLTYTANGDSAWMTDNKVEAMVGFVEDTTETTNPIQEVSFDKEDIKTQMRIYEDDFIQGLIDAASYTSDEVQHIEIARGGRVYFAFDIRPLSEEEYDQCKKKYTKYVRNKQLGMKLPEETNSVKYRDFLIYTATTEEYKTALWDNKTIWEALRAKGLQIMNGLDVIEYSLKAGEKDRVLECIDTLSGYDNNMEEVVKN